MLSLLHTWFWWLDLAIAAGITLAVTVAGRASARGRRIERLFWLGAAIGLTWEVPLFLSATLADAPVLELLRPPPIHPLGLIVAHSLWDGGLFLAGVALVALVGPRPILARFRWRELGILVLWGQLSALAVEVGGITGEAWSYVGGRSWNPTMFHVAGHPLTVLIQVVWLVAPAMFYVAALRLGPLADGGAPDRAESPRTG